MLEVNLEKEYAAVCALLKVTDRPSIHWDEALTAAKLNGLYLPHLAEIRITTTLAQQPEELRRTIVHELAHHIMYRNGYRVLAHGWPFLALEMTLALRANYDHGFVLTRNAFNWEPTAGIRLWGHHALKAIRVFHNIATVGNLGDLPADTIARSVLSECHLHPWLKLIALRRHAHHANTQGLPLFMRDLGLVLAGIGVLLGAMHMLFVGRPYHTPGSGTGILAGPVMLLALAVVLTGFALSKLRANEFVKNYALVAATQRFILRLMACLNIFERC